MTGPAPKADPRAVLGRHLPWLVPGAITVLAAGWDSDAYALDGRIVVKRPKNAPAELRLRREAALLAVVRPAVTLPVPDLHLVSGPPLFSWHRMLPGQQLLAGGYAGLAAGAQVRLAQDLGRFLAELHRIDLAQARAAGAVDLVPWRGATQVLALAMPVLPAALQPQAARLVADYAALPPDPLGLVYGHFDSHGWNMAFDLKRQVLNGIYDFADSGIGPRHHEFIYTGLISFALERIAFNLIQIEGNPRQACRWLYGVSPSIR